MMRGPDNGLCKNTVRQYEETREKRNEYNDTQCTEKVNRGTNDVHIINDKSTTDDMSIDSNAGTGLDKIECATSNEAEEEDGCGDGIKGRGRRRKLDWMT